MQLEGRIKQAEEGERQAKEEKRQAEEGKRQAEAEVNRLNAALETSETEKTALTKQVKEKDEEISRLQIEKLQLEANLSAARESIQQQEESLRKYAEEIKTQQERFTAILDEMKKTYEANLEQQQTSYNKSVEKLKQSYKEELEKEQQIIELLQKELALKRATVIEFSQLLADLKRNLELTENTMEHFRSTSSGISEMLRQEEQKSQRGLSEKEKMPEEKIQNMPTQPANFPAEYSDNHQFPRTISCHQLGNQAGTVKSKKKANLFMKTAGKFKDDVTGRLNAFTNKKSKPKTATEVPLASSVPSGQSTYSSSSLSRRSLSSREHSPFHPARRSASPHVEPSPLSGREGASIITATASPSSSIARTPSVEFPGLFAESDSPPSGANHLKK